MKLLPVKVVVVGIFITGGAMAAPTVTPTTNANALATSLVGPGVTLIPGSATLTQISTGGLQAGTFSAGLSSVGFAAGVVLSTGNVSQIPGANTTPRETLGGLGVLNQISTDFSGGNEGAGLAFDRVTLQFSFRLGDGASPGNVGVRYVFASEEYINYVGSIFNDLFSFELDGVNIALISGSASPVAVNSVNPNNNSAFYINNVLNTNGLPVAGRDFQFDGLTSIVTARANLSPGVHTMRFTITDISDGVLDSGVFIEAGSFMTTVPEPSTASLIFCGLTGAGLLLRRKRLVGVVKRSDAA